MKTGALAHRLLALAVAGWLLFNYPLAGLWAGHPWRWFALWAVLIAVLAAWLERGDEGPGDGD